MYIQVDRFVGNNEAGLTAMRPTLTSVHPDDAFSSVPYEKGSAFLFYLETLLGGPGEAYSSACSFCVCTCSRYFYF